MNTLRCNRIYPIVFGLTLICSCNSKNIDTEKLSIEKDKIRLEQSRIDLENKKLNQTNSKLDESGSKSDVNSFKSNEIQEEVSREEINEKQRQKIASNASKANRFQPYTDAVVVVKRTYFYAMPDEGTKKSSFLIQGDRITVEKSQRNYVYVTFTNAYNDITTTGWIKSDDLEPIESADY